MKPFSIFALYFSLASSAQAALDLSQPWVLADNYNDNGLSCRIQPTSSQIAGYAVIKDGEIVAEEMVTGLIPAWSTTKSWTAMIVGMLVDQGLLSLTDTLGNIFDDEADWDDIVDAEEKQTLTVRELLTFTSGLCEPVVGLVDGLVNQNSLADVLNATRYSQNGRGSFEYLGTNHIMARVVFKVSGQTPLEVASDAFTAMGLVEGTDYTWDSFGGVQGSAFGFKCNARTLAKLGLVYLQQGMASDDKRIVSAEWVAESTTNQLKEGDKPLLGVTAPGYGYQWYVQEDGYEAQGIGGQFLSVYPEENVVVSIMTTVDAPLALVTSGVGAFFLLNRIEDALSEIDSECDCEAFLFGLGCK